MHWATAPAARAQPAAGGIGLNGLRVTVSVVFENENDVTVKKKTFFLESQSAEISLLRWGKFINAGSRRQMSCR